MSCVAVIGCGHVGNSLIETFSQKFQVFGYDINQELINLRKEQHKNNNNIYMFCGEEKQYLINADMYCISVPTLIDSETKEINIKPLLSVKSMLEKLFTDNKSIMKRKLIVIESSCYIGMTREIFKDFCEEYPVYLYHSAERYDEGRTQPMFQDIPKIIGPVEEGTIDYALNMYKQVFSCMVPVSNSETSEMSKLTENCQRIINISYINQITDNCEKFGVNEKELLQACGTKPFGFYRGDDTIGLDDLVPNENGIIDIHNGKRYVKLYSSLSSMAGSCLSVNADWLGYNANVPVLQEAVKCERYRPQYKATELVKNNPHIRKVLIMGISFKRNCGTILFSAPISYGKQLEKMGLYVDYVDDLVSNEQALKNDIVNIMTTAYFLGKEALLSGYDMFCFTQQHDCMKPFYTYLLNRFGEDKVKMY